MARALVAVVRTRPETVLEDTVRAFELGGGPAALDRSAGTILKDNISWHYPFPSANTTPWRLQDHRTYERWLEESAWGCLFRRYLETGAQAAPPARAT